jgi:murein DD-endopeptidase MepM/ murein hydrolase activator NlpD
MNPRHVLASGLLGFVLGAFTVASFQGVSSVPGSVADRIMTATQPAAPHIVPTEPSAVPALPSRSTEAAPSSAGAPAAATSGRVPASTSPDIETLIARRLTMPVQGVRPDQLVDSFHDARDHTREHEAIDILAPRGTPVVAVEDGTIAKLFFSKAGGNTIYEFDPSQQFCYYYAHLDAYAAGLKDGDRVSRGQTIGYVGTTGNAPKNTPHLHFAINRLTAERHWWQGTPLDPFAVLSR